MMLTRFAGDSSIIWIPAYAGMTELRDYLSLTQATDDHKQWLQKRALRTNYLVARRARSYIVIQPRCGEDE